MTTTNQPMSRLLQACRAVMPGVAGVVLADQGGGLLAHEDGVPEPQELARRGARYFEPGGAASALVPNEGLLYLVVHAPAPESMISAPSMVAV